MAALARIHREGPGLHEIKPGQRWYGSFGGCNVCGDIATDALDCPVVARAVSYWDVDDGWRIGILCLYCADEILRHGGPQPGDYAYQDPGDVLAGNMPVPASILD